MRKRYYKKSYKRDFYLWLALRCCDVATILGYLHFLKIGRRFIKLGHNLKDKGKNIPRERNI